MARDILAITKTLEDLASEAQSTAWIVLTGGPCSGKSSVLAELAGRGYAVKSEQALAHIQARRALGETMAEITTDLRALTQEIFEMNRLSQAQTPTETRTVFDRALPDVIAFALADGLAPDAYLQDCARYRFAAAFVFEYAGPRNDGTIYHSRPQIRAIEDYCTAVYRSLAQHIVRIPLIESEGNAVAARADFVETSLNSIWS